jgi:hypothetical protein
MLSCAKEFLAVIEARRPALIECARIAREATPGMTEYTPADLEQMVAGFVALVSEAALGTGSETFDFFMDTVVPGMLAAGDSLPTMMHGGTAYSNLFIAEVSRHIAAEHYDEISRWMGIFIARYIVGIMNKGLSVIV